MKLLRSEKARSVLVVVGAIGAIFWSLAVNTHPSSATSPTLTLSIAGGSNTISLNIMSLNGSGGTFRTSDTTSNNISVSTNNFTGYTLGILAKAANVGDTTHSNALSYTASGTTYTIPSITTAVSQSSYSDDAYAEANSLNNTWGYRPSTLYDSTNDTNVSNTDYLPAPTSTETANQTIIAKTSSANTSGSTDGYNIAIGARVNNDTPPGTYTNTFVITAVANLIPYSITYNQNTTDTVSNMPTPNPQTGNLDVNSTTTITLSSNTPTRSGYAFKGWCTEQVADDAACTGTEYAAGANYDIDYLTGNNTFTLYARWAQPTIYDEVIAEWTAGGSRVQTNDTDTNTGIQAAITTSNSGVFKYNSTVFGTDSDAEKEGGGKYDIYYYRGILDSNLDGTTSTYGSNGDGATWPNYVKLGDTCWRIVRTTGSGGVKMVYNGLYSGGTTANSCANATTNAQVTTKAFNGTSFTYRQIVRVGYTYNSTYATNTAQSDTIANIFGTNSTPTVNNTRSDIKTYIEDTWYANNMTAWTSILEASAGYCNDRTMNTTTSWTTPLAESSTIAATYGTSGLQAYYFGAYPRNMNAAQPPSLTCAKYSNVDRSTVDLYRYVANSTGVSNELKYPVALLTADELSFAGSGSSTAANGSAYHANSYLRSGSDFWLLSPSDRYSNGYAYGFRLYSYGLLYYNGVSSADGVRPAISLDHETAIESGDGTAVSPWVIAAPQQ